MSSRFVDLHQVSLLCGGEFGLLSAKSAFGFRDLHAFPGSSADQAGLELGNHGEDVEQKSPDGVVGVVDRAADAEFHVFGREFVNDVFGVAKGACEPVEFGNDERVAAAASGECFAQARPGPVGAGKTVICVDQGRSDSESFECVLLSGQILFVCGYACVPDQ